MKSQIRYKAFNPINYVLALYNPENTPLVDPLSFMLGRFRVLRPSIKKKLMKEWLDNPKEETHILEKTKTLVERLEDNQWTSRRAEIRSLSIEELIHNVENWIKRDYHNLNLMREGGSRVFNEFIETHSGEIWLSADVRRRGSSRGKDKFNHVQIAGPFETSKTKLAAIHSDDREYLEILKKHGYNRGEYISPEVAAVLFYAKHSKSDIKNLNLVEERRNTDIWLPIQPQAHIMIESLIAYLTRGDSISKYDLNKKLFNHKELYDSMLLTMIEQGKAGFIPIAEHWIFNRSKNDVPEPQRWWFDAMQRYLANDYSLKGLAIEKKDSEYETVSIEYVHKEGNKSVRLMFFDNLPPLVMERTVHPKYKVKIFEDQTMHKHPFAELFVPKVTYDDRKRRYTASEIKLTPEQVHTPEDIVPDYYQALAEFFPKGISGFRKQIYIRQNILGEKLGPINKALAYHITNYKK
jgi:hypothetical protein